MIHKIFKTFQKLAIEYSKALNIPLAYCRAAISELQIQSIDNKRQLDEFKETGKISRLTLFRFTIFSNQIFSPVPNKGVATIKVRLPNENGGSRLISVKIKLNDTGRHLQESVANELGICPSR